MAKLKIEYRIKDEESYLKGKTYLSYSLLSKITEISIAPEETRTLDEIIRGIEKELQDGFHLQKNEKFEISKFDKYVIDYEKQICKRIDSYVYNFCKNGYKLVQDGKATWEDLIEQLEERRCSKCI
jgi:hypothetical protein